MTLPIETAAQKFPNQLAYQDSETKVSYAELVSTLENSPAMHADLQPGDHVAWCPRNNADAFLTFWALQQRNCVACPISHRFPAATRDEILKRIDAKWLPDLELNVSATRTPTLHSIDQPATLILSSGSTGVPKAIIHTMAAHVTSASGAATNMPLIPGDRWLWSLPLCHVSGLSILVRCAVAGATVVGIQANEKISAKLLDDQQITHLSVVTTQLRRLLAEENFPSPWLKAVLLGGSSVNESLVSTARSRGVPVSTTYGLSEMATQVTTSTPTCDPSTSGHVLAGRELKITESGEILVRGKTLYLGYYQNGRIESVVDDDGWFATKDLGILNDDGQLIVHGRIDNMFVSGGENIHPETIERALASLFGIEQVVVVSRPDPTFGARPVAFVLGSLPSDWEAILRQRLQGYEIPDEILPWPAEAEGAIKPNRKLLQQIASGKA